MSYFSNDYFSQLIIKWVVETWFEEEKLMQSQLVSISMEVNDFLDHDSE